MKKHLKDKDGNTIQDGVIIRWFVEDSDDNTTWEFTGMVVDKTLLNPPFKSDTQYVVYLGGGIDFGKSIGKKMNFEEVQEASENNDEDLRGISVLGEARQMAWWIKKFSPET